MVSVSLAGLTHWVNPYSRLPGALGLSSSLRRALGAPFFVVHLAPLTSWGRHRGVSLNSSLDTFGPQIMLHKPGDIIAHV
jgi:hypothetical protein